MIRQHKHDFDVIIVGGGLVGAACATALAQQGQQVALVDNRRLEDIVSRDAAGWDSRVYVISPGNAAWLQTLGAWTMLDQARVCPIDDMDIWGDLDLQPLRLKAADANVARLGFVVENRQLQRALWSQLQEAGVHVMTGIDCVALDIGDDRASLKLENGKSLTSGLVVAADGSNSWVRQQAHLPIHNHNYEQMAVVANFETELHHRHTARQWFGSEGILAWLPLPGKRISMVWSTSNDKARQLLNLKADSFVDEVNAGGKQSLGELKLITPAVAFPLSLQTANQLVGPRIVLVGDAAHQIHPLAGQGVNLGFRDVISLAAVLNEKRDFEDIGDLTLLRRYERARRPDMLAMKHMTHGLQMLFANEQPAIKRLRNWGLRLTDGQPALKRHLIRQAII